MIKIYSILTTLIVIFAAAYVAWRFERKTVPEGQAGVAYVETEDGSIVRADTVRPPERTRPPTVNKTVDQTVAKTTNGKDEEWLTSFTLIERSGKRMGSEDLKGRPYVAGFFFTSCPSICPKQNEKVRQLQEKFKGQPVRFISISCDPEVDRPEVLSAYADADRFKADENQWLFFTGDLPYIRRVGAEYFRIPVDRYFHPEKFALIDADGNNFGYYSWNDANQWQALQADIEKLIAAGGTIKEVSK
jgi:protein SCO1/2